MTSDARQREYWESDHGFRTYEHEVVRAFARQRLQRLGDVLDLSTIGSALDVGCGDGFSTFYMQEHVDEMWAVDRSSRMLERHPMQRRVAIADARDLPFSDNRFGLVYGWEVLHHIANPTSVVREMARVSQEYVLLIEPNRANPAQFAFALVDPEHRWVLRYSLSYMRNLLRASGLEVVHTSSGGWIFPNVTPRWLLSSLQKIPYSLPFGISNWALGRKSKR